MHRACLAFVLAIAACNTGLPSGAQNPISQPPSEMCLATTSGGPIDASAVSGSFAGPELAGTFCNGGTYANLEQTPDSIGAGSNLILFITTQGSHTCSVQTPSGGYDCELDVSLTVPTPSPGTYQSGAGSPCDRLLFTATGPSAVTSCGNVVEPEPCPAGCVYGAQSNGVPGSAACVPKPGPSVQYAASTGGGVCLDTETYAQLGGWTLTLTSVTQEAGGSAQHGTYYSAHGSLTANMISGRDPYTGALDPTDGDNTSATLSIAF